MCMYKISLFFSSFSACVIYEASSRWFVKEEEKGVHIQIQCGAQGFLTDVWAELGDSLMSGFWFHWIQYIRFVFELHDI